MHEKTLLKTITYFVAVDLCWNCEILNDLISKFWPCAQQQWLTGKGNWNENEAKGREVLMKMRLKYETGIVIGQGREIFMKMRLKYATGFVIG